MRFGHPPHIARWRMHAFAWHPGRATYPQNRTFVFRSTGGASD